MALTRSKIAVLAIASLAALWVAGLVFGLSWLYGRKVSALVGHSRQVVERELGPPTLDWGPMDFACAAEFPCSGPARGGPVFLYEEGRRGYYLFFDRAEELVSVQAVPRR
ncbi:MAG TPA: hypothetical protein VFB81_12140 [Myxococcales bacterium]|nr:hypothetical protein [Myxococcales bacterium]